MKRSGIYIITNTVNGRFYIGSSTDLKGRKYNHFSKLKHGISGHKKLQSDYDIYGADSFVFEVIMYCPVDMLSILEESVLQDVIPDYNTYVYYNSPKGIMQTEETKRKKSEVSKGRIHSEEARKKMSESKKKGKNPNFGKTHSEETLRKMAESRYKPVIKMDLNGNFIAEYSSLKEASRINNCLSSNITSACRGVLKTAKGFKWAYKI